MRIFTPAKINLTLEVLGKRSDGYHELVTWMIPIALYDRLTIEPAAKTVFESNVPELQRDPTNLIMRALDAFQKLSGDRRDYRIVLEKHIPIGAGLGGGSSNAAATLRLLNRIAGDPISPETLSTMAAELGSDVAFFIEARSAWCTGRGEEMELRHFSENFWICLAKPGFLVPTAWAYATYAKLPEQRKRGEAVETVWGSLRNDLEPAVFTKYLLLAEIKRWFQQQTETEVTLMSGSGSTTFAVTRSAASANALRERFLTEFGENFWTFVGQLNPSPCLAVAEDAKTA
ncbi:MAG: 4-(cytidine 5'-diphospho)-2-C-methyl-D-erythritol kinase [Chthoniobacterales bacterium]